MLVFTRKREESLVIGNEIEIKVLSIGKDHVKLGIRAPRHISVHRWEVFEAIKTQNQAAAKSQIVSSDVFKKVIK